MSSKSNILTLIDSLQRNPGTDITDREIEDCILKFGSYVSIIKNRQLNQVGMVIETIRDDSLQQECCYYFSCESFEVALSLIFTYNPHLVKSKAVKDNIKKWKRNDRLKRSSENI